MGDYFGEQAILNEVAKTRNASIETIEETELIQISAKSIHSCWEEDKNLIKKLKKIGLQQAIHSIVSTNQIYGDLKDILQQIEIEKLNILELSNKTTVFNFDDVSDNVYLILKGKIELRFPEYMTDKSVRLTIYQGHIFGELGVIENKPRSASALAVGNVRLLVIHGDKFREIYQENPFLKHLLSIYKKTYQLPLLGIVEQYVGSTPEIGPTITNIFKLKDGKSVIATRSLHQHIFTMSLVNPPQSIIYKYEKGSQHFVEISVHDNYLVCIKSYGEWDDLQTACSMMLENELINDSILEQFHSTGKLMQIMSTTKEDIICTCLSITRGQILSLMNQGITDYDNISKETGAGTVCGSCRYRILEILGENPWICAVMQKGVQHNNYIQSYFIKPIDQELHAFLPGQHILVQVKVHDNLLERCYTMSDTYHKNALRITIKREEKGLFTKWLFEECPDEINVNVTQPQGNFTLDSDEAVHSLCIAGGIGITPFISYAKGLISTNSNKRLHILYCASTKEDFIFTNEFNEVSQHKKSFTIDYRDTETHGSLAKQDIIDLVKSMGEPTVYICGSEGFVNMVNTILEEINYDAKKIFIEKFLHAAASS